jgi:hypothetical protein
MILVLSSLGLFSVSPAAARAETFNYKFRGLYADAYFSVQEETGCVETASYLTPSIGKTREDKESRTGPWIYIVVYQYDYCTGDFLLDAWAFTSLSHGDFILKNQLNYAELDTRVLVEDLITGDRFPVDIHLTWTATGEGFIEREHTHLKEPGLKVNYKYTAFVRPAAASGSINGLGLNFASQPSVSAQLSNVKAGFVEITMNP